jgi:outer membrane immunogenic protein
MRKAFLIGAALVSTTAWVPAIAADLPYKARPLVAAPAAGWTGFYLGANVGGVWTHSDGTRNPIPSPAAFGVNPVTGAIDASGVAVGMHGGFNYQFAPSFVAGIEADWTWTNASSSFTQTLTRIGTATPVAGTFATMSTKLDWLASVRGRLGYLVTPDLLAYVTGGGAWGGVNYAANVSNGVAAGPTSYVAPVTFSNTPSGYVVGGGLEWKMAGNWLVRGEYLFYRLGGASATGTSVNFPAFPSGYVWSNMNINEGRVGLSYKF